MGTRLVVSLSGDSEHTLCIGVAGLRKVMLCRWVRCNEQDARLQSHVRDREEEEGMC